MTIRHLKIFVEVADTGSMSAAAKNCFISQPTVSQAIRELEEHYGVALFERLSRKLFITPAGSKLLTHARLLLDQYHLMEESMRQEKEFQRLRIGATITVGTCLLSGIINDLHRENPALDTYAYVSNTSVIEEKLLDSTLDVAIVEGVVKHEEIISIPVIRDFLVLACSTSHPFASRSTIHVTELAGQPFVMREQGSGTRELFSNYMAKQNVLLTIAWESDCPEAIRSAVLNNDCLAVISVRLFEDLIREGKIHIIKNQESEWERNFYLVYHKDRTAIPSLDLLQKILSRYQGCNFLENTVTGTLTRGS